MRYIFLSYFKRCENNPKTLGALFFLIHDYLKETSLELVYLDYLDIFYSIMRENHIEKSFKIKEDIEKFISLINCEMSIYTQEMFQKGCGREIGHRSPFFLGGDSIPLLSNT